MHSGHLCASSSSAPGQKNGRSSRLETQVAVLSNVPELRRLAERVLSINIEVVGDAWLRSWAFEEHECEVPNSISQQNSDLAKKRGL